MCQPRKWWVGLLPLALLWLWVNSIATPRIESDLAARTSAAIKGALLDDAAIAVQGRDVTVSGRAFVADAQDKLAAAAAATQGVRRANDAVALIPEAKPYAWSMSRDGAKLSLAGNVPDPTVRAAALAAARKAFPGADISDTMTYARGAPTCFAGAPGFALAVLSGLGKGKVDVSGATLSVAGEAEDFAGFDAANAAVKAAPQGCTVAAAGGILPPAIKPYTFSATRAGASLALAGYVPDAATKAKIVDAAKAALANLTLADSTRIARGAPENLPTAAAFGFAELARLTEGSASVVDGSIAITGDAATPASYAEALAAPPPQNMTLQMAVRAPVVSPYAFAVNRDATGVSLTGYLPSAGARERIVAAAKAALPGAAVTDKTAIARGAPAGIEAAAFAVGLVGRLASGGASLTDTALSVSGDSPTPAEYAGTLAALQTPPSAFTISSATIRAPEVLPFTWSATREASTVTLKGFAPSPGARDRIAASAKGALPGVTVVDQTVIARGAPAGIEAAVQLALSELAQLSTGSANIVDGAFSIAGDASGPEARASAIEGLAGLPPGWTLAQAAIRAPEISPFTWSASREGDAVTLSGHAASDGARERIVLAAQAALPGVAISDTMLVARGAPAGLEAATTYALRELAKLTTGTASIVDTMLTISGVAADASALDGAPGPDGFTVGPREVRAPLADAVTWSATRDGDKVRLAGYVASREQRQAIREMAEAALPGAAIDDASKIARGVNGDLEAAASFALGELARLSGGKVSIEGRDIAISGEAATATGLVAAIEASSALPGGYGLADFGVRPPEVKPFVWSALRDGAKVTLSGSVPSQGAKERLAAIARTGLPGVELTDQTLVARGAPGSFEAMAGWAFAELALLGNGVVQASDQGLAVAGDAATSADFVTSRALVGKAPANFELLSSNIRPPKVRPYVFTCARAPDAIVLTGSVPSEAVKASVLATAGGAARKVKDGLKFASGAPAGVDYAAATDFCLAQVAGLTNGSGRLVDAGFSIAGEAPDLATYAKVTDALKSRLPAGLRIDSAAVKAPSVAPYLFEATKQSGMLVLGGYFPDDKSHEELVAAARKRFFAEKIDDRMKIGSGAPANFGAASVAALARLSRLVSGKATLTDMALDVSGEAPFKKVGEDIDARSADQLPDNYQVRLTITAKAQEAPLESASCQDYFTNLLTLGSIRFDSGSADIKPESYALLDALTATAARCQDARIEVAGHTDATGSAELNNELSLRRAEAVVAYLTRSGLTLGVLTAVGYGSSRPVAANDTDEGRAKNRRIVFEVK